MGERHKRERGKAEEDLGGYGCGMCDESGHESGALMTVQKQQYLHTPPASLHFTLWKQGTHSQDCTTQYRKQCHLSHTCPVEVHSV